MIEIDDLSVTYDGADSPALVVPHLRVAEGELVLVAGPTGCGKSTLLSALNGLVPHFSGGTLRGHVLVGGRDTATHRPRDLADVVGLVRQNPAASFVTDTVEDEIAYGMEVLGVAPSVMRRRVEEILDVLGLAEVRGRTLHQLSGGQQQRVAIAAVLAAGPDVLVLDEPTSALDPVAAEDVLSALTRLVHDMALTVVLAEHRLERVVHHADRIVLLDAGRASAALLPQEAMAVASVFPPVVGLGRVAGWHPLPLSVREARRCAVELRHTLPAPARTVTPAADEARPGRGWRAALRLGSGSAAGADAGRETTGDALTTAGAPTSSPSAPRSRAARTTHSDSPAGAPTGVEVSALQVRRGGVPVLRGLGLTCIGPGITVLMGRNGSGKSTLLWTLAGQFEAHRGRVRLTGQRPVDPRRLPPRERITRVGLVPQDPMTLLYADSVGRECRRADLDMGAESGTTAALFARIAGDVDEARHPRDLSEGQRLALALAIILAAGPELLLLDEPTRGLDYAAKSRLVQILTELAGQGRTILVATHDVELAAEIADRVVLLADGTVVADDSSPTVLADSTAYAPQVSRVMHPLPYLTVDEVAHALQERP